MSNILGNKNSFGIIENEGVIPVIDNGFQNCLFTIGIPTFKRVEDLKEALDSVYSQLGDIKYNVLVVDNNPDRNDETETFLQTSYSHKAFFSYYKNSENIGMAGNWNRLFQLVHTPYLIMLHDDDYLFSSFLIYIDSLLKHVPNAAVINSKKVLWNGHLRAKSTPVSCPRSYICHSINTNLFSFETKAPSGCLFRVEDVIKMGGFDSETYPSIDYVAILKLLFAGKTIITTTDNLMLYRQVDNASCKESTIRQWIKMEYDLKTELSIILKFDNVRKRYLLSHTIKYWLYCLKTQYSIKESYKGIKCGGRLFIIYFIIFQFFYQRVYINHVKRVRI